jgi:hypothetical protein
VSECFFNNRCFEKEHILFGLLVVSWLRCQLYRVGWSGYKMAVYQCEATSSDQYLCNSDYVYCTTDALPGIQSGGSSVKKEGPWGCGSGSSVYEGNWGRSRSVSSIEYEVSSSASVTSTDSEEEKYEDPFRSVMERYRHAVRMNSGPFRTYFDENVPELECRNQWMWNYVCGSTQPGWDFYQGFVANQYDMDMLWSIMDERYYDSGNPSIGD